MDFFQRVIDFFNHIIDWLNQGIYDFVTQLFAQYVMWATIQQIKFKLWAIDFAWDVAQNILSTLNITNELNAAFGSLDADVVAVLNFFSIPHAISIMLSAAVTKFVLRFMGL